MIVGHGPVHVICHVNQVSGLHRKSVIQEQLVNPLPPVTVLQAKNADFTIFRLRHFLCRNLCQKQSRCCFRNEAAIIGRGHKNESCVSSSSPSSAATHRALFLGSHHSSKQQLSATPTGRNALHLTRLGLIARRSFSIHASRSPAELQPKHRVPFVARTWKKAGKTNARRSDAKSRQSPRSQRCGTSGGFVVVAFQCLERTAPQQKDVIYALFFQKDFHEIRTAL